MQLVALNQELDQEAEGSGRGKTKSHLSWHMM